MPSKTKKQPMKKGIGPKTGFHLALVVLLLLTMVVGVWAISTQSFEVRSDASGGNAKAKCSVKSTVVCRNKEVGAQVTQNGASGKCVAAGKPIKKGENGKCEFRGEFKALRDCNTYDFDPEVANCKATKIEGSTYCRKQDGRQSYCCWNGINEGNPNTNEDDKCN
jgi:hypothetical protein